MPPEDHTTPIVDAARRSTRAETRLVGIYEISKILARPARIEVTLSNVITLLSSFLDMENGLIALLSPEGEPEVVVGAGWSESTAKQYFEHLPERAVGQIVVSRVPFVVRDVTADPLFTHWLADRESSDRHRAFVGVPIKDHDRVIGTLSIECPHSGNSAMISLDDEARFLTMIANLVGQTISLQAMVARDRERMMTERHRLEKQLEQVAHPEHDHGTASIVGESEAVRSALEKIRIVARTHLPVLLRGESGTGKELFAQAIHDLSPRRNGPCIKLNCAALPETVLESELFGHEKGAFTGAINQRKGRFELADGGTLFLDEIGDISGAFQAKLLRVLQEGEFERIGGTRTLKVDVRLVAATNRNLEAAVAANEFRADLYYRISVVPIVLAPLRQRREDIPLLAKLFLDRFNEEHGVALTLSMAAVQVLQTCDFPGNVRELESCVRRTAAFTQGSRIGADDFACSNGSCLSSVMGKTMINKGSANGYIPLPVAVVPPLRPRTTRVPSEETNGTHAETHSPSPESPEETPIPGTDQAADRERLVQAMETAGWVQAKAARILGLTPRQMGYALRKHQIDIKRF
jgi:Nif-specific regulatory protein